MADKEFEEKLRSDFDYLKKQVDNISAKYRKLCAGKDLQTLCGETAEAVAYTDKLVEILQRFEQKFFNANSALTIYFLNPTSIHPAKSV